MDASSSPDFPRSALAGTLRSLAEENVFLGTSSWKYPGWCGQIYDPARYTTRGKFSKPKFERECLSEYAEVFPSVCVDAGYYQFPSPAAVDKLFAQVPRGFRFGYKVTDTITILEYPKLDRFGILGGSQNPHFLDADLFSASFLGPLREHGEKIGPLIFEFSRFHPGQIRGAEFVERLDAFLGRLPTGWQYGIEIRNPALLRPEYFAALRKHGVAHVYNQWAKMPTAAEQMAMPESRTAEFAIARFLLTPGRTYARAVEAFSPYAALQAVDAGARKAGRALIASTKGGTKPSYLFVNNRLEGNSPSTIAHLAGAV